MLTINTNTEGLDLLIGKLEQLVPGGKVYDDALRIGASTTLGHVSSRIHDDGKAADDSPIGQYSGGEIYINPSTSKGPKFTPEGKTGKTKFENGKLHKTKYFGSYAGYRQTIGRRIDTVDLNLTGQLRRQFTIIPNGEGYGLGWNDTEHPKVAAAMEAKYGKRIWALTKTEKEVLVESINERIDEFLK